MEYKTNNLKETIRLGEKIIKKIKGGKILELHGDLGSGKTTLVKGMALGLGIKKPVRSPTFNLIKIYTIKKNKKIKLLIHADCYRLKKPKEILETGLLEYLQKPDIISIIEWPEKIKPFLKKYKTQKIYFKNIKENIRKILI